MKIPIILRLKRRLHKGIAEAQDILVDSIYNIFENAVLHGGTAIWRCYKSRRFSEDIDVYIPKNLKRINKFFDVLVQKGFDIIKKRVKSNSLFSVLKFNTSIIRFEAIFKRVKGVLKEYETVDGNFITVYTLTPEQLVKEKISAYLKRFKVRDLYDIFFLLRYVDIDKIKKDLLMLVKGFRMPDDKDELNVLIIEGLVPNVNDMLDYIKNKLS